MRDRRHRWAMRDTLSSGQTFLQAPRFLFLIPVFPITPCLSTRDFEGQAETEYCKRVKSTWHRRQVVASGDLQNLTSLIFKIAF